MNQREAVVLLQLLLLIVLTVYTASDESQSMKFRQKPGNQTDTSKKDTECEVGVLRCMNKWTDRKDSMDRIQDVWINAEDVKEIKTKFICELTAEMLDCMAVVCTREEYLEIKLENPKFFTYIDSLNLPWCGEFNEAYFTDDFLIVADETVPGSTGLYQIQISTGNVRHLKTNKVGRPVALAMDPVNMHVYYTDVILNTISRFSLKSQQTDIIFQDLTNTSIYDGIELDLDNRLLYISDARKLYPSTVDSIGNGAIIEMSLEGNILRRVVGGIGMLPRTVQLDKLNRMLYWTDWGAVRAGIYKISLIGSGETPIPIITGLHWPNAFVADFQKKEMFWADAGTGMIEASSLDGTNRRLITAEVSQHYFGMTLTSTYVYLTDWKARYVRRFDRTNYKFDQLIYFNQKFERLFGITHCQSGEFELLNKNYKEMEQKESDRIEL